jgi:integrase
MFSPHSSTPVEMDHARTSNGFSPSAASSANAQMATVHTSSGPVALSIIAANSFVVLASVSLIPRLASRYAANARLSAYALTVEQATVDRKLEVLRAMFNWAIEGSLIPGPSPMKGIKLFKPNSELVRYLNSDEYAALLEAADHERWHVRPIIELAANTALKKRNILRLRWDECDFNTGVIRVTKNQVQEDRYYPNDRCGPGGPQSNSKQDREV